MFSLLYNTHSNQISPRLHLALILSVNTTSWTDSEDMFYQPNEKIKYITISHLMMGVCGQPIPVFLVSSTVISRNIALVRNSAGSVLTPCYATLNI